LISTERNRLNRLVISVPGSDKIVITVESGTMSPVLSLRT
jgi:hypothetical protein